MAKETSTNYFQDELNTNDDIQLINYINPLLRNKKFIATFTIVASILSVIYSYRIKPIYRGSIEILATNYNDRVNTRSPALSNILNLGGGNFINRIDNRILILQSPSILNPVFEFVKKEYERKGINTKNMNYNSWFKKELTIQN